MKKRICALFAAAALTASLAPAASAQERTQTIRADYAGITICLDGIILDPRDANGTPVEPFAVNGTTYLPVRAVASALGLEVVWNEQLNRVVLSTPALPVAVPETGVPTLGEPGTRELTAVFSGFTVALDGEVIPLTDGTGTAVEPFSVDGTIYLPVRAVASALGLEVEWNAALSQAVLTVPPVRPVEDAPRAHTVQVNTVSELLAAIAPDTEIILALGTYNIMDAVGQGGNLYFHWTEEFDGPQLVISNLSGLTIRGQEGVNILTEPRYADVFHFEGCKDVVLSGLTVGHTPTGSCLGSVLNFTVCEGVRITGCSLYGCGTYGVELEDVKNLLMEQSEIYGCSYGAATILRGTEITFDWCEIHDNTGFGLIGLTGICQVTLSNCAIRDNTPEYADTPLLSLDGESSLTLRDCQIQNNFYSAFSHGGLVLTDGCSFDEDNTFEPPV